MREPGDDDDGRARVLDDDEGELVPLGEVLAAVQREQEAQRGRRRNRFEHIIAAGE